MKVDGRCLCSFLTYEAEVDAGSVEICNCTDCQTLSGSAFRVNVPVVGRKFRFLTGEPGTYVKITASGNRRVLAFCPQCGSSIYSSPEDGKDGFFGLRVGSLRQRGELIPTAQYWCSSGHAWRNDIADIPAFDGDTR